MPARDLYHDCVGEALVGGKVWIQHDGTYDGIANALVEPGIPRDRIVLAFKPPDIRQYTGFAVS
ncbi:MAG TPA: element excision factor XisI family protein [Isosphaeraceae bacterium]|nr:element excision factor XisI family protein [Isosphaeraceae bacterium]